MTASWFSSSTVGSENKTQVAKLLKKAYLLTENLDRLSVQILQDSVMCVKYFTFLKEKT